MKVVRYFVKAENEKTGEQGFVPLWIPKSAGFDPSGPRGMVHDALEHRLCDRGHLHEEAMAFGRLMHVRDGYMPLDDTKLGAEFAAIMRDAFYEDASLMKAAPPTRPRALLEGDVVERLSAVTGAAMRALGRDLQADSYSAEEVREIQAEQGVRLHHWLALGCADAQRRYGRLHSNAVADAFYWAEEDSTQRHFYGLEAEANLDDCLRMTLDLDRGDFQMKLLPAWRSDYRRHPEWLEGRVRAFYAG